MTTAARRVKGPHSSGNERFKAFPVLGWTEKEARAGDWLIKRRAMRVAGKARTRVPFSPQWRRQVVTRIGPKAMPVVPPTPNTLIPRAFFSPATKFVRRAPSGWNAAIPIPQQGRRSERQPIVGGKTNHRESQPRPGRHRWYEPGFGQAVRNRGRTAAGQRKRSYWRQRRGRLPPHN